MNISLFNYEIEKSCLNRENKRYGIDNVECFNSFLEKIINNAEKEIIIFSNNYEKFFNNRLFFVFERKCTELNKKCRDVKIFTFGDVVVENFLELSKKFDNVRYIPLTVQSGIEVIDFFIVDRKSYLVSNCNLKDDIYYVGNFNEVFYCNKLIEFINEIEWNCLK